MRLFLLLSLVVFCNTAAAQISPGPLSKAHSELDGPTQCGACHTFGLGKSRFKCLDCHTEIARRLQQKRGLHARVVKSTTDRQACVQCHTEHYGANFNIVRWETSAADFDHRESGYPLEGKHAGLECARCHNPQHISRNERATIKVKDPAHTYLGLSPACLTCHQDAHRGQLGNDCARCHAGFQAWKPVSGFNHSTSRYPLTGKHGSVGCAQCHGGGRYRGVAFASCGDCHKDPHRGSFKAICEGCHSTAAWKQVRLTSTNFDHGSTVFPLKGLHARLVCSECHRSTNFKISVAHARCGDCHRDDPHKGQFRTQDCASCHNEQGFRPSLFTVSSHQKTTYPLLGKHTATACEKCHIPAGRDTLYKVKHDACVNCHRDSHDGQFADGVHKNQCESCHTVDGFRPTTFTLSNHAKTRFQLTGGHAATPCADCHKAPASQHLTPVQYRFGSLGCETCHLNPHNTNSNIRIVQNCEGCHNTRGWRELAAFDHSTTTFALAGAHRAVTCTQCHLPVSGGTGIRRVTFSGAPTDCAGCHEDSHGGQFASGCSSCHGAIGWKPTTFDHEQQSKFSLAGAHRAVACSQCHSSKSELGGRLVVIYRGTPSRCSSCHSGN